MGRSAYLCPTQDCLKVAQRKNRLGRSLKAAVPDRIYQVLWERLSEEALQTTIGNPPLGDGK